MSTTMQKAEFELDLIVKSAKESGDSSIVEPFIPEILELIYKFTQTGQSGMSAPYTARVISQTIEKLCLHKPLSPITGEDSEWNEISDFMFTKSELKEGKKEYQNNRCSSIFKKEENKITFCDAIVWQGEEEYDTFTGTVENIRSSQEITLPFVPKTFYIDVYREIYNEEKHGKDVGVISCQGGDFIYFIKDKEQLNEALNYFKNSK
jgi:hypothetical protein